MLGSLKDHEQSRVFEPMVVRDNAGERGVIPRGGMSPINIEGTPVALYYSVYKV